jgi:hypothetical protein
MLLRAAESLDTGFDCTVLAQMLAKLGRFEDDEIPLSDNDLQAAKTFFRSWIAEPK